MTFKTIENMFRMFSIVMNQKKLPLLRDSFGI